MHSLSCVTLLAAFGSQRFTIVQLQERVGFVLQSKRCDSQVSPGECSSNLLLRELPVHPNLDHVSKAYLGYLIRIPETNCSSTQTATATPSSAYETIPVTITTDAVTVTVPELTTTVIQETATPVETQV